MIQKIRENVGTIVICGVILFGVPAAMSSASPNTPEVTPTPVPTATATLTVDIPLGSGGAGGNLGGSTGAGGGWGED